MGREIKGQMGITEMEGLNWCEGGQEGKIKEIIHGGREIRLKIFQNAHMDTDRQTDRHS